MFFGSGRSVPFLLAFGNSWPNRCAGLDWQQLCVAMPGAVRTRWKWIEQNKQRNHRIFLICTASAGLSTSEKLEILGGFDGNMNEALVVWEDIQNVLSFELYVTMQKWETFRHLWLILGVDRGIDIEHWG